MVARCRRLTEHPAFQRAVLGLILANAVLMGLEAWPAVAARGAPAFAAGHAAFQALFVLELALRVAAHGRRPQDFLRSGWNAFDLAVVLAALLPAAGPLATLGRLARVLRVARLVSGVPDLRLIVGTMLRSVRSMGPVVLLLGLVVYVYAVAGHHLFGAVDPAHWGDLGRAARTLFYVITLEGWVELLQRSEAATPHAWAFYVSFIVLAVFVVINLFIAVVVNNLEKTRREEGEDEGAALAAELRRLGQRVDQLARAVHAGRRARGRPARRTA